MTLNDVLIFMGTHIDSIVSAACLFFLAKSGIEFFSFKKNRKAFISSSGKTFDEMTFEELDVIHEIIWKEYEKTKGHFVKDISETQIAMKEKLNQVEDAMVKKEILEMNGKGFSVVRGE